MSLLHVSTIKGLYIGQVKGHNKKNYETVTGRCKTMESALSKAAKFMHGNKYLRVLLIPDDFHNETLMIFKGKV